MKILILVLMVTILCFEVAEAKKCFISPALVAQSMNVEGAR